MAKTFGDTSRFWVIFDTCTLPDYYLDVHKLLAIPKGATLRYNYKEKYLSASGLEASSHPHSAPKLGMLFYGQRIGFHRGDGTPPTGTMFQAMLWIPTRIVEMLCIPERDGETFNYDFKVLQYPSFDHEAVRQILEPLVQARETPFNKWVTTSSELKALNAMRAGSDRENWGNIVTEFHKPESQFAADVFWRILGPTRANSKLVMPSYEKVKDSGKIRKVESVFKIEEGVSHGFEVVSASPLRTPATALTRYSITCASTNDTTVEVIGSGEVDLRQQAADRVQFVGKVAEEIADRGATLRFETKPKPPDWPGGPELELLVRVVKSRWKMVTGLILGVIGLVFSAYGAELLKSDPLTGGSCFAIGVVLVIIGGILIFRKMSLKS
jgi:hypothetical protein